MPVISWRSWPILAAVGGALLVVSACAPNRAVQPRLDPSLKGAERDESRYGTLLRLASSARAAGDPAAAVKIYQQAIALDRNRIDAHVLLGDTLVELKAFDDAAKTYQDVLKRDDDNAAGHRGYARAMLGLNRPEAAIVHYQAVLGHNPNDVPAHNGLGVAFDLAGQHEAAEAAYQAGLAVAPDSMLLRNNLGLSLALAGRHPESIALLRAVADEPGAKARNRQNLALAYGLAGDLVAAERVSRLDLDEEAVQNNLAYYAALAAVDDRRKRAAALGVNPPELNDREGDANAGRRLSALALEGNGLELGLAPTGRWFVNLGDFGSASQAASAWRQLRSEHNDLLGALSRLAGVQDGRQPLLVGPLADADRAQSLCGTLRGRGQHCRALAL
ncbi:MAG TPA: tetratricopeptide repeat protein [Geminicoccaceae bacterium]|nr:tetratricopeptide repeat protein [Geminicoccaceae bacterium]